MKKWTDTPKKKRNGMHVHEKKKKKRNCMSMNKSGPTPKKERTDACP